MNYTNPFRNSAEDSNDVALAITQSISYSKRVTLTVPDIAIGLQWVNDRSESYDHCNEGKTEAGEYCEDVWGDGLLETGGGEFRLRLISEKL